MSCRGWRAMFERTAPEGYGGCSAAIKSADYSTRLGKVKVPVQMIGGSEDTATPPELIVETASLIPGAAAAIIEGAGALAMRGFS